MQHMDDTYNLVRRWVCTCSCCCTVLAKPLPPWVTPTTNPATSHTPNDLHTGKASCTFRQTWFGRRGLQKKKRKTYTGRQEVKTSCTKSRRRGHLQRKSPPPPTKGEEISNELQVGMLGLDLSSAPAVKGAWPRYRSTSIHAYLLINASLILSSAPPSCATAVNRIKGLTLPSSPHQGE